MARSHMQCLVYSLYFLRSTSYLKFVVYGSKSGKASTFCALQIYVSVPTIGYGNAIHTTDQ